MPGKSDLKREIHEALSYHYQADDGIIDRLATAIGEVYAGDSMDEWEEVAGRFQDAFGIDDDEVVRRLGVPPREAIEGNGGVERLGFDTLVRDGWFRRYLDWTADHESPSQYHFGAAVALIAAALPRRPLIEWEARRTYPNLFVLLIGPSGARKGSAIERAVRLISPAIGTHVYPNEGTPQGLAAAIKRRYLTTEVISDGIIIAPEFNVLVSDERNKEGLVQWLTDWYDSPDLWERGLRGDENYRLENVYLSVLGGSTLNWLKRMPRDAVTGGFMPRFILFDAPGKRHWRARPRFDRVAGEGLANDLRDALVEVPEEMGFAPEAARYLDEWYERELYAEYEATADEDLRKWIERKQAATMKLAVVWQLADGGSRKHIEVKWLAQARRVIDWGDQTVMRVYSALGVTRMGEPSEDVLRAIEERGGRASMRTLARMLRKTYSKRQLTDALETLKAGGLVRGEPSRIDGVVWVGQSRSGARRKERVKDGQTDGHVEG